MKNFPPIFIFNLGNEATNEASTPKLSPNLRLTLKDYCLLIILIYAIALHISANGYSARSLGIEGSRGLSKSVSNILDLL